MDAKFQPATVEKKLYQFWEENKFFEAKVDRKKRPFSIILPPPNANADLHLGHAMYVYEDIMIRYHKLKGFEVLWLPGADHAGFETQYVFEKELQKKGQSRFDYDRETLYKMIWDFVMANKSHMEGQLRRLGFALDWSREKFTLDPNIVSIVYKTFKKMFDEELIYRDNRLVNYCTHCGTSFSDLEVKHVERKDPLYYLKYGPFVLATVRPETKFGDTAVAVNPKDRRYKKWVGKEIEVEGLLGKFKMKVITDEVIDPKFGTGVAKVTPAHDFTDFEIAKRHNLAFKIAIDKEGKLTEVAGKYQGLPVLKARKIVADDLQNKGLMVKVDEEYIHTVATCYKCGRVLEPQLMPQWYVKIRPLAEEAIKAIKAKKVIFVPKRFERISLWWFKNFHDWNISRQVVWGIRIPAYKCRKMSNVKCQMSNGWFILAEKPNKCLNCGSEDFEQDTDTFDTWFSSAQWPFATLNDNLFNYFYPTSVMETGYDILPWWVCRMLMIGLYATKKVPFKTVFLHGLVRDKYGKKMSKSKGNVINPMEMIDKYGADALRTSLVFGVKEGNDQSLAEEKIVGMRNFANKIWNIGRFIHMNEIATSPSAPRNDISSVIPSPSTSLGVNSARNLIKEFKEKRKKYFKLMNSYRFSQALGLVYEFLWHRLADFYIEELKESLRNGNIKVLEALKQVYFDNLIMLHPFMPFVTEAIWKQFHGDKSSILL